MLPVGLKEWAPNTVYQQGDCVVIPDGAGGYMGDANGSKTWLLCCVGSGASPDTTPWGITGATKTRLQWATLFEGNTTDENVGEATVTPATLQVNDSGPDGTVRWGMGVAYFVDTSRAGSSTNAGTFDQPYTAASQLIPNQVSSQDGTNSTRQAFLKRGTIMATTSIGVQWIGRGSSRKMRAKISDYGNVFLARPVIDAVAAVGQAGVFISKSGANAARWVECSNVEVCNAGGDGVSVFLGTSDPSLVHTDIYLINVRASRNQKSGIQVLTGGNVDRSTWSQRITIEDCEAVNNLEFGIVVREWWDGVRIIRPRTVSNGGTASTGSYGVSTMGNYQVYSVTGWTNVSGNLWERTFTRTNAVIDARFRRSDLSERVLTVGTYGALAAPYSIANNLGTIQVLLDTGDNPNSNAFWVAYARCKNILIEDVYIDGQFDFRAEAFRFDGDGIGIDQFSENVYIRGGYITKTNAAVLSNQPLNLQVQGMVIAGNGAGKAAAGQVVGGVMINHPLGTVRVAHNTIADNEGDGVRIYSANAATVDVRNNLLLRNTGAGIRGTLTVSGVASSGNRLDGNGSTVVDVSLTGSDSTASTEGMVNSDYTIPGTAIIGGTPTENPLATAGVYAHGLRTRNGRPRPGRVPVGAYLPKRAA